MSNKTVTLQDLNMSNKWDNQTTVDKRPAQEPFIYMSSVSHMKLGKIMYLLIRTTSICFVFVHILV